MVVFKPDTVYNIFKLHSELPIDNISVGNTVWVFDKNFFYLNSLDKYGYIIFNNNVVDITILPTKRIYYILEISSHKMILKSAEKYDINNIRYSNESSYSILEFKK